MKRFERLFGGILGIVLIAAILFATAYKASKNEERRARFRERDQKIKAADELGQEVENRISMAWLENISIDEFEKYFGELSVLEEATDPEYADKTHIFFHKGSQRTFYLRFDNGSLAGFSSHYGAGDFDTGVVLESNEYLISEVIRKIVLYISIFSWCIILISSVLVQGIRKHSAVVLIVTALISGLCWFLAPNYTPTLKGIMSNDSLFFFLVMLAISIGFLSIDSTLLKSRIQVHERFI